MRTRAPAMPRSERRKTIIDAARPLLLKYGPSLRTAQVAAAAGIAEGTIFRIFPTKQALVQAIIDDLQDPTGITNQIENLDSAAPTSELVIKILSILETEMKDAASVFTAAASLIENTGGCRARAAGETFNESLTYIQAAIAKKLPTGTLRINRYEAASFIMHVAFSSARMWRTPGAGPSPEQTADLILNGIADAS